MQWYRSVEVHLPAPRMSIRQSFAESNVAAAPSSAYALLTRISLSGFAKSGAEKAVAASSGARRGRSDTPETNAALKSSAANHDTDK